MARTKKKWRAKSNLYIYMFVIRPSITVRVFASFLVKKEKKKKRKKVQKTKREQ